MMSEETLNGLANSLKISAAYIHQAASFYHYSNLGKDHILREGTCGGPACCLPGVGVGRGTPGEGIACPGLCDQAPAALSVGVFRGTAADPFLLPPPPAANVDGVEEVLFRDIRTPGLRSLDVYRASGGYAGLQRLVEQDAGADALETLRSSGLLGRGGAGFPLAAKWQAVRETPGDRKYVVCNADEGEPGTFKDRPLLHLNPHLLIESMAIAAHIVGATAGVIYLRYEYPEAYDVLNAAIAEAEAAGLIGNGAIGDAGAQGGAFNFDLQVARGLGSYVCGEETSLLNSLEGLVPWPRERPPFPTQKGLWGLPTVINNVETFCSVPAILSRGADWYRALGRDESAGTKLYSVSGRVAIPGPYELPLGATARELIEGAGGGALPGRTIKGYTIGGISGGLLAAEHLDMPLDYAAPRQHGFGLGSGGVVVFDDACCVVDLVRTCMLFLRGRELRQVLPLPCRHRPPPRAPRRPHRPRGPVAQHDGRVQRDRRGHVGQLRVRAWPGGAAGLAWSGTVLRRGTGSPPSGCLSGGRLPLHLAKGVSFPRSRKSAREAGRRQ